MTSISASGDLADAAREPVETDAEIALVARAVDDPAAFEALYWRHHRPIWRYLRHRTGESHAADDLVAEVFLDFLKSLPRFRSRGIGVRGWLYRVATRKVARWSRKHRSHETIEDDAHARSSTVSEESAPDQSDRVRAALSRLPQRLQAVLVLHHVEGLAVEEIARSLCVREGTVKSRLARGREALRRSLVHEGGPR
jgi:RNA polymerase sigma-70 factor (ECF subfamily)